MTSKKVWSGRIVLILVILAIIASLSYLLIALNKQQPRQNLPAKASPASLMNAADAEKLVKKEYDAYVKTAYNDKSPNPKRAFAEFKKNMTTEGQAGIGEYSKDKDSVVCTESIPEDLSYTKPTTLKSTALITVISALEKGTAQAVVTVDLAEKKIASVSCTED